MNKITLTILGLITLLFSSCQFSENIYINEDGSGRMEFSMDASELMAMAGEKMEGEETVDSTIVFREFLEEKKDSIATLPKEEQEKLKALENFKMHMLIEPKSGEMVIDLLSDFKDVKELQDMFKAMNNVSNLQGKGGVSQNDTSNPFSSVVSNGATSIEYSFKKGIFKRTSKVVNKEVHQQEMDSLGEIGMMLGGSKYKLNYHFPKPIKSVSNENAMFSDDRKSFILEVGFMDSLKNPELLNLEVVLED